MDNNLTLMVFISMAMFAIGILGVILKRNILIFFLSIEMMLNASNLLFISFSQYWKNYVGQIWVFFILIVAATEAAIGLALLIHSFRSKESVDLDQFNEIKE